MKKEQGVQKIPYWNYALFQGQCLVVLMFWAVNRMNAFWMSGKPFIKSTLVFSDHSFLGNWFGAQPHAKIGAILVVVAIISIGLLLLDKKHRKWAIIPYAYVILFFHLQNIGDSFFRQSILPTFYFTLPLIFIDPEWFQQTLGKLSRKIKGINKVYILDLNIHTVHCGIGFHFFDIFP